MNIIEHYDKLIEENNDPFRDPQILQDYMNKWDGSAFIDAMQLDKTKHVLEIGVGTGRLANGATHLGTHKFDFFPFTCGYLKKEL